jgi:cell division transport system ATP-binding protein
MIEFQDVCKRYATGQDALNNVNFSVEAQEIVFLTGHSGAGKSTVLKLIMLMEKPSAGQVLIAGRSLERLGAGHIPYHRRQIGVVFQNHQLLFDRTVFDNVALPLQICGIHHREVARRVRASLDKVGLLNKETAYPISLSGGEQQRVGIARAVVNKPPLLLADEPTGNLDPDLSAEIMEIFRQFSEFGVTVMIASHDLDLIKRMHRRVLTLEGGKVIHDGVMW